MSHAFGFVGGAQLSSISASWFVSYAYHKEIDHAHKVWMSVKDYQHRANTYAASKKYHDGWLHEVLQMNNKKLNTSSLGLGASLVKQMALDLIKQRGV